MAPAGQAAFGKEALFGRQATSGRQAGRQAAPAYYY